MADFAHPEVVVSTDWVDKHKGDDKVAVVEVDVDTAAYGNGHVPGAVGWSWQSQLSDPVRRDIIQSADLEKLLGESGIDNDTTVILYGDNNNWFAAWAFWQLKIYGHKDVRMMNGGRKKWEAEGKELNTDAPSPAGKSYSAGKPDWAIRSMLSEVREQVDAKAVDLVDVRSPAEFSGEILAPPGLPETCQRGGHIPGASNIPWAKAVNEDGTFKTADELKTIYGEAGISFKKPIIAYCRIGERSSHSWFVLKYLAGHENVKNYDGSWTEWGNLVAAPIEK